MFEHYDGLWFLIVVAAVVGIVIDARHKRLAAERYYLECEAYLVGVVPRAEESNTKLRRRIEVKREHTAALFANGRRRPNITLRSRQWGE